jgi:hypothetical protein
VPQTLQNECGLQPLQAFIRMMAAAAFAAAKAGSWLCGLFGMTEVMPCYKTLSKKRLSEHLKPVPFTTKLAY